MDKLVNLKFDWSTDSITFNGNGKLSTLNSGKGEYQALTGKDYPANTYHVKFYSGARYHVTFNSDYTKYTSTRVSTDPTVICNFFSGKKKVTKK